MADRVHNPFQAIDISVPSEFHSELKRYCQGSTPHGGTADATFDMRPFPRMVDFWFLSICVAVRLQLEPVDIGRDTTKIIDGSIFMSDPWRIHTLMLIAIGKTNDEQIVSESREVIALSNRLAAAGLPKIIEMLKGESEPIWNLSDAISTLLKEDKAV